MLYLLHTIYSYIPFFFNDYQFIVCFAFFDHPSIQIKCNCCFSFLLIVIHYGKTKSLWSHILITLLWLLASYIILVMLSLWLRLNYTCLKFNEFYKAIYIRLDLWASHVLCTISGLSFLFSSACSFVFFFNIPWDTVECFSSWTWRMDVTMSSGNGLYFCYLMFHKLYLICHFWLVLLILLLFHKIYYETF